MDTGTTTGTGGPTASIGEQENTAMLMEEKKRLVEAMAKMKAEKDAAVAEMEAKMAEKVAGLEKKLECFPSLAQFCKRSLYVSNETASSSHTNTGHSLAKYQHMDFPKVTLPESFWDTNMRTAMPWNLDGEAIVNVTLGALSGDIIRGLGLEEYIGIMYDVPILDTAADVSFATVQNKVVMGSIEGKKEGRTAAENSKIFGSDTQVAGEVFEQLVLTKIQNHPKGRGNAFGLLSTLNSFQLVAAGDRESVQNVSLDPNVAIMYFQGSKTSQEDEKPPDRKEILSHNKGRKQAKKQRKDGSVLFTSTPRKEKTQPKKGRVAVEVEKVEIDRTYYASPVLGWGNEETNRQIIELLAAFVLLTVQSFREAPGEIDLTEPGARYLTREIRTIEGSFSFKHIVLPVGVLFDEKPKKEESTFYAIRQLGYGASGSSCISCTSSCAPCVIKFYRRSQTNSETTEDDDLGDTEEKKWKELYLEKFGFDFVKYYNRPRKFLVMPFLEIPKNDSERQRLIEGDKSSLLYNALQHIAEKGYVHKEPFFHHVGIWKYPEPVEDTPESKGVGCFGRKTKRENRDDLQNFGEAAVFCDLAHLEKVESDEERTNWVLTTFENMRKRTGTNYEGKGLIW